MSSHVRAPRVPAEQFERKYQSSADPWDYRTSSYEHAKYADTLAALGAPSFVSALEVGCSIGVFTELLAPRCERLVAIDFSPRAIELARARLAGLANVEVVQAGFPEQAPAGAWELVLCSEVLYYLDEETLTKAIGWLAAQLQGGATVLVVSWRGGGAGEPMTGDEVHDRLSAEFARWHTLDGRRSGYRLDRFDSDAG
jgi:SAM-dependent methyltransferase